MCLSYCLQVLALFWHAASRRGESCDISRMGCNGLRTTSRGHRGRDRCPLPGDGWLYGEVSQWSNLNFMFNIGLVSSFACSARAMYSGAWTSIFAWVTLAIVAVVYSVGNYITSGSTAKLVVGGLFANVFHVCLRQRLLDLGPQQLRLLDGRVGRLHHLVHTGSEAHRQPVVARIAVAVELVGIRCSRRVGSS
ncbi:unnamed protein product [Prorocentrum cordatum]|uniref:Uncharacterized protein n=1 Tax=Prorocentrum cordatum TaxID=2364126 RepID=A0ABN9RIY0_9DINO|nr:unnamed protein product [Polarella glacialis]